MKEVQTKKAPGNGRSIAKQAQSYCHIDALLTVILDVPGKAT